MQNELIIGARSVAFYVAVGKEILDYHGSIKVSYLNKYKEVAAEVIEILQRENELEIKDQQELDLVLKTNVVWLRK